MSAKKFRLPPPANPTPQPIGVKLGVGPAWQPGLPGGLDVVTLKAPGQPDVYVVRMFTSGGGMALAVTADELRRFITQAEQELTGLTIAAAGDMPTGHQT